ncbi:MAG: hypothetical protein EOO27_05220 [Comamonadaceae bacterium]|nr:MAG: hypothetical protein EOO27_05220 [Comamonadaceae bacterium]
MANSNGRSRPSRAEIKRRTLEAQERHAETPRLPEEHAEYVAGYTPRNLVGRPMEVIRPFLHEVLARSNVRGVKSVMYHCTHLTELSAYALHRGLPLTIEAVLTTDLIEEYISIGMDGKDRNRQARRDRLMNLARTVNPGPTTPATFSPIPRAAIQPCYTPLEMTIIRRVVQTQPTPSLACDLCLLTALGAGAGADSIDLRHLYFEHIEDRGSEEGIWVAFQEPRPRMVPVRLQYEGLLRSAIAGRRGGDLVIGVKEDRAGVTASTFERAVLYKAPELAQARLRATWLADLMTDPVPLALILRAAGLKSARSLADLLPHLDPWLAEKGITLPSAGSERGEGR